MLSREEVIFEYEQILLGKKKSFDCAFSGISEMDVKKNVGIVWRYAIENLLGWDYETAIKHLDKQLVENLYLDKTLHSLGYISAREYSQGYHFVLQYAFPENKMDDYKMTIEEYKRFAKIGKYQNYNENYTIPKNFFSDDKGIDRASIIMRYAVNTFLGHLSTEEMYEFFANEKKAKSWIRKHKLSDAMKQSYEEPLQFFHFSIPKEERDQVLFFAYTCKNITERYMEKAEG